MASIDIVAAVLAVAALIGSLAVVLLIAAADRVLHLHIMQPIRARLAEADLPAVFLDWVLALLLFAGSLHVDLAALRQHRRIILVLATIGVILSATVFGFGLRGLLWLTGSGVGLAWCFVLGAILAPTDAVVLFSIVVQGLTLPGLLRRLYAEEAGG